MSIQAEDIRGLIYDLQKEQYLLATDYLANTSCLFLRELDKPYSTDQRFSEYTWLLAAPNRALTMIRKQINPLLSPAMRKRLEKLASAIVLFSEGHPNMMFYLAEDVYG